MTHNPSGPERRGDGDRDVLTGPPRWVKISALVGGIIVLAVVVAMLLTGGQHGPARHLGMGELSPSAVAVQAGAGLTPHTGNSVE